MHTNFEGLIFCRFCDYLVIRDIDEEEGHYMESEALVKGGIGSVLYNR